MKIPMKQLNQKGFALVEGLLILVILAAIGGVGYYVYQANNDATDTQNAAQTAANSATPPKTKTNYVAIKEWSVRSPYDGKLDLSYTIKDNGADFSSKQLSDATNGGCVGYGGHIVRYMPNEEYGVGGETASQVAKDPNASVTYKVVGSYYYFFVHDQSLCPDISDPNSAAAKLQSQTEDAVKALVPKLTAAPKQ